MEKVYHIPKNVNMMGGFLKKPAPFISRFKIFIVIITLKKLFLFSRDMPV